jgi:hypothetical protein
MPERVILGLAIKSSKVWKFTRYYPDMSRIVKLSDDLVSDARCAARIARRSVGQQIEYWAVLGRVVARRLGWEQDAAFRNEGKAKLSEILATVDTPAACEGLSQYHSISSF